MAFNGPVLLKRIPDDPAQRKLYRYADYTATGGYQALAKAAPVATLSEIEAAEVERTPTGQPEQQRLRQLQIGQADRIGQIDGSRQVVGRGLGHHDGFGVTAATHGELTGTHQNP